MGKLTSEPNSNEKATPEASSRKSKKSDTKDSKLRRGSVARGRVEYRWYDPSPTALEKRARKQVPGNRRNPTQKIRNLEEVRSLVEGSDISGTEGSPLGGEGSGIRARRRCGIGSDCARVV